MYQDIVDAVHYSCMLIQDEVVEDLLKEKGHEMQFDKEVVAQIAYTLCDTLCNRWPFELIQFSKHAKRSVVNITDLKLLFRRNENLLSLIEKFAESSLNTVRQRQSRKGLLKKSNEGNSSKKVDEKSSTDMNESVSKETNILKLKYLWDQPSVSRGLPSPKTSSEIALEVPSEEPHFKPKCQQGQQILNKESLPCAKRIAETVPEFRKIPKSSRKQRRQTANKSKQFVRTNASEVTEKQERDQLNVDIPMLVSLQEKGHLRISDELDNSSSKRFASKASCLKQRKENYMNVISNTSVSLKEKDLDTSDDPHISVVEMDDDVSIITPETISNSKKRPDILREVEVVKNQVDAGTEKPKSGSSTSVAKIIAMNSDKSTLEEQNSLIAIKRESNAADECFSAFKFESDEEECVRDNSPTANEGVASCSTSAITQPLSESKKSSSREQRALLTAMEEQQNIGDDNDLYLDATIFDF